MTVKIIHRIPEVKILLAFLILIAFAYPFSFIVRYLLLEIYCLEYYC